MVFEFMELPELHYSPSQGTRIYDDDEQVNKNV